MRKARVALSLLVASVFGCVGCGLLARTFLPERYAINFPSGTLLGRDRGLATPGELRRIRVPEGFSFGVYAEGLPNARLLRFTPAGDLLVSTPRSGSIRLMERDADGDGRADGARVLLDGLNRPHGLDLRGDWLYVAETDAVGRIRFDAEARAVSGPFERVVTGLPAGGNHWTRTLRFGPDGWMYVSIGSSCNVCIEEDPRRASIVRYRPDGSGEEVYATGLRNAVGFDWHPETGDLYATDNGRDLLGNDFPPCELNRVVRGGFYGWPFANGDRVIDPDLGAGHEARVAASHPPAHAFRAHNAPLGITFLRGERLPPEYRGAALVALHGSWNRTEKDGYEVVLLRFGPDGGVSERPFATGFEVDEDVIGRPVDVAEGPDGAIYISDDYAGAVYRVAHGERARAAASPARAPRVADPNAPGASPMPATEGDLRDVLARGAALYASHGCAGCHEPDAAPQGVVVKPLAGLARRYGLEDMVAFLAAPQPPMPVVELTPEERRDLAMYLLDDRR